MWAVLCDPSGLRGAEQGHAGRETTVPRALPVGTAGLEGLSRWGRRQPVGPTPEPRFPPGTEWGRQ